MVPPLVYFKEKSAMPSDTDAEVIEIHLLKKFTIVAALMRQLFTDMTTTTLRELNILEKMSQRALKMFALHWHFSNSQSSCYKEEEEDACFPSLRKQTCNSSGTIDKQRQNLN